MARTKTSRASSPGRGRFAVDVHAPPEQPEDLRRRRQPEPTGLKKVMGSVLSAGAAKKAAPSSRKGKAGGFALAAAAAGVAFKNRDKISGPPQKGSQTA